MDWNDLRVVLVGPLPPPAGGMANQTWQLAGLLEQEGAVVELVQVNAPYRPQWVERVRGVRSVFRLVPYLFRLWRTFARADLVHVMANSGWSWHLFAAPAIWLASMRQVPVVVNYRGGEAGSFLARSAALVRPTMRRAAALIVPSGYLLEEFARHGMQGRIVPNIVDVERFSPGAKRTRDGFRCHIVVARNLEPIYGNDIALRAFAKVLGEFPGATLSIAGSGPEHDRLVALAGQLGIAAQVRFTGRLDRDAMAALYRSADVLLNPTHVDNMPNSVLEALASGVPVVSTDVGGVPWIVRDGDTALLVSSGDASGMADALMRLMSSPELAARLSENGLAEAGRYRWECVRAELAAAYHDAIVGKMQ